MEFWFTEKQTENHGITTKVKSSVFHKQTDFQKLDIIETNQFGKMMLLDGMVMTTDKDEFVYHEMITHVAMNTHKKPVKVLVIGGGDGGVVREVLKYPSVEKVVLAEIDGDVIEQAKIFFPKIAGMLNDSKVQVEVCDAAAYVKKTQDEFDVIIVDSTEPVGPGVTLFESPFYRAIYSALHEDGVMVAQTDTPWFKPELIERVYSDIKNIFPITKLYTAAIPTYPSGLWSFTIGSKKYNPLEVEESHIRDLDTKYYNAKLHKSAFDLPNFVFNIIRDNNNA